VFRNLSRGIRILYNGTRDEFNAINNLDTNYINEWRIALAYYSMSIDVFNLNDSWGYVNSQPTLYGQVGSYTENNVTYFITDKTNKTCTISYIYGANTLTKITVNEKVTISGVEYTVTEIEPKAIFNQVFSELKLPNSITKIGSYAFYYVSMKNLYYPGGVNELGENLFDGGFSIDNVYFGGDFASWVNYCDNTSLSNIPTYDLSRSLSRLYLYENEQYRSIENNFTVSEIIKKLPNFCFYKIKNCSKIVLKSTIEEIEKDAFALTFIETIFYQGDESSYNAIIFEEGFSLGSINICYYSETTPSDNVSSYWHYVNDVPTIYA